MNIMPCLPTSFVIASLAFLSAAAGAAAADMATEEFHQTYPLSKDGRVQLENLSGKVRIVAWDREEVKVDAIKRARTEEQLQDTTIEVDAQADGIKIRTRAGDAKTKPRGNHEELVSVDYLLLVPQQSHLDKISSVQGGIEIEQVTGAVKASSVDGKIKATGLTGDVELSSVNGPVEAAFTQLTKPVSLKSVNGPVTVSLPSAVNAELSARTLNGPVTSDFPLEGKKQGPVGKNLQGTLGDGGPALKISTVNGPIRVDRNKAVALEKR
jgi:hypothetical protein